MKTFSFSKTFLLIFFLFFAIFFSGFFARSAFAESTITEFTINRSATRSDALGVHVGVNITDPNTILTLSIGTSTNSNVVLDAKTQTYTLNTSSPASGDYVFSNLDPNTTYHMHAVLTTPSINYTSDSLHVQRKTNRLTYNQQTCVLTSFAATKSGVKPDSFYNTNSRPLIEFVIKGSEGCIGKTMLFNLYEIDGGINDKETGTNDVLKNRKIAFDDTQTVIMKLKMGDQKCERPSNPDCEYGVSLTDEENEYKTWKSSTPANLSWEISYNACQDTGADHCEDDWDLVSIQPNQSVGGTILDSTTLQGTIDQACFDENNEPIDNCYPLLAPLPGLTRITDETTFGEYANVVVSIIIGLIGLLAVLMIVVGGIQYMSTDAIGGKTEGRKTIQNAVIGLLLALGSFVILNTIDPDLTKIDPDVGTVGVVNQGFESVPGGVETGGDAPGGTALGAILPIPSAVSCPKQGGASEIPTIVNGFVNNTSYRYGGKNLDGQPPYALDDMDTCSAPSGPLCLDCSGFVHYVYYCAGIVDETDTTYNLKMAGTAGLFGSGVERITAIEDRNGTYYAITEQTPAGKELKIGDLLGWKSNDPNQSSSNKPTGHVIIYIGNGKTAESTSNGGGRTGNSIKIDPVTKYGVYNADNNSGNIVWLRSLN